MPSSKKINKRKKSIMIIDKEGRAREVLKDASSTEASTLIDTTHKSKLAYENNSVDNNNSVENKTVNEGLVSGNVNDNKASKSMQEGINIINLNNSGMNSNHNNSKVNKSLKDVIESSKLNENPSKLSDNINKSNLEKSKVTESAVIDQYNSSVNLNASAVNNSKVDNSLNEGLAAVNKVDGSGNPLEGNINEYNSIHSVNSSVAKNLNNDTMVTANSTKVISKSDFISKESSKLLENPKNESNQSIKEEGEKKKLNLNNNRNAEIAAGAAAATAAITGGAVYANNKPEVQSPTQSAKKSVTTFKTDPITTVTKPLSSSPPPRNPSVVTFKKDPITTETKVIDKHVTIDENQNQECGVAPDNEKSLPLTEEEKTDGKTKKCPYTQGGFVPHRIGSQDLHSDSEILKERENDNVVAEGHFWKRRRIFACFWHEKYFVLTKDGILKYHKANGTKKAKGNWNIKEVRRIHEIFMGGDSHPYRLILMGPDDNILIGFDDLDNREFWLRVLSRFINSQ